MNSARGWVLAAVVVCVMNCVPYAGRPRGGRIVKVALECGVDWVQVSGIHDNAYCSDYRVTQADAFPFVLGPKDGRVRVNGRDYRGGIDIRKIDGRLWAINVLDIESYLKGVVPCEIGGVRESQFEAARAQAVAARTYAMAHLGQYADLGFDLYATVQDQVYKGIPCEREITDRAVESTRAEVLFHDGKPIEAKYHSTCGGRTADFSDAWGGVAPPYLRSVVCRFCEKSPHYRWTKTMTLKDFFSHVRERLEKIGIALKQGEYIHSFRITRSRTSKRLKEIILVTNRGEHRIANYRIRTLFGELADPGGLLKSTLVYIKVKGDKVFIEGGGFGHGVGMCQFGALGMAEQGRDYRKILYHYYRGARIKKVR